MTDDSSSLEPADFPSAGAVIAAFGGIRPMATRLDVPVSTVQGWKQRDAIPENRFDEIRAAARHDGITLDALPAEPRVSGDDPAAGPAEPSEAGASAAVSAAPAPASRGGAGAMPVAVLALLVALACAGWLWWSQQNPVPSPADAGTAALATDLAALRGEVTTLAARADAAGPERLAALAGRVDALAGKLDAAGAATDTARLDALARDLDDLKAAITDNRAAASANVAEVSALRSGLDSTLSDLSGRLVAVENRNGDAAASQSRAIGLAIAAAEIRRTLRSGAPFADDLATLRALAAADPMLAEPLATLAASAATGLPTVPELARRFDALIAGILSADRLRADTAWYRRALDQIASVVSVRRVGGDAAGDTVDAVVARTEAKLADGDLAGAVAEAATLQNAAGAVAAPWLDTARRVLSADAAVAAINARALAALATARGK